ncbi:MAG: efflux RND transporter periplasmic adaptor subunit [Woeseia sp.]|nr:efflux RND transporter periplasmic adaptor subunit [Woeseia sp.]MBT8096690.1 efflux RND transporter periplasmic adaptor subunit [Woeseia sp.]NNL54091.1 efflux RND transporter periplasmic adaptor subunit [Woeseia sp.]
MKSHSIFLIILLGIIPVARAQMPPPTVVLAEAQTVWLAPTVDVPGTVVSRNDARLASDLAARLTWIAEVGTTVKEGDTIARLTDITFRLNEMEADSRVARERARVEFLNSEVGRLESLAERNNAARSQLELTRSDLAVAEADLDIARAQLGQAKVAMALTEITAPFDGVITERLRNVGERLNAADVVLRLVNPASIEVVARAPLSSVNFIAQNDELELFNDYRNGRGTVRTIVPVGNPQSHMFEVRLNVAADKWTVGESVRLSMPTAVARQVLSVPRDALVLRREGTSVFRIDSDQVAEQVSVVAGMGAGDLIEVIGDVRPGDRIVVRGAERLAPGMSVSVAESDAPVGKTSAANK